MKDIEDNSIEYKAEFPNDINDLKAEIVSFLNSNKPGTIYLGATDSGEVIEFASPEEKSLVYKSWEERLASDDEFRAMVNKSARASYETFDSDFSDLTFSSYISKLTSQDKRFDENSLRLKHRETPEHFNMAGLVLSDQNNYRALVSVFDGITTREFLDKKTYGGSIVRQIDDILSYIDVYNTN